MTWNTYRDSKGPAHGCKAYYDAHANGGSVSFDMFRARVKRGMGYAEALATPRIKQWSKVKDLVLKAIADNPGVTRHELTALVGKGGSLTVSLDRLLAADVIRYDEERIRDASRRWTTRKRYYLVAHPSPASGSFDPVLVAQERAWTPPPYVNPIRARALGLPVAETERTREVREAFAHRPGRAA